MILHKKLNQAHRPCKSSLNYNYGQCIDQSIITKAGCQPHWRLFTVDGVTTCDNVSMVNKYQRIIGNISLNMDRDEIFEATKCLVPCTYFEYKVHIILRISAFVHSLSYYVCNFHFNSYQKTPYLFRWRMSIRV